MTARRFVVWLARSALIVSSATWAVFGCSRHGEGERCDSANAGDSDCEPGLRCIRCAELASGQIDRCCPESGSETVGSCERSDISRAAECAVSTGGTGGSSGAGGSAGRAGSSGSGGSGGSGATSGTSGGGLGGEGGADSGGAGQ